jgi:hypothetical protein
MENDSRWRKFSSRFRSETRSSFVIGHLGLVALIQRKKRGRQIAAEFSDWANRIDVSRLGRAPTTLQVLEGARLLSPRDPSRWIDSSTHPNTGIEPGVGALPRPFQAAGWPCPLIGRRAALAFSSASPVAPN